MSNLTLKDIAKLANVSEKTVSRVVNRQYGVGEDKRREIEQIIKDTGFKINVAARGLASSRNYTITILYRSTRIPDYISEVQLGAMQACDETNYHLLLQAIDPDRVEDRVFLRSRFQSIRTDGVILIGPFSDSLMVMDMLDEFELPYVRLDPTVSKERSPYVEIDDEQASYDITRLLIEAGHTAIGCIPLPNAPGILRNRGFQRAMKDAGLAIQPGHLLPDLATFVDRTAEAEALLSLPNRPTAIVCGNDGIARWTMAAAAKLGLNVPEDVSLVGFDDIPAAEKFVPPLTTVHMPIFEMAKVAAGILIDKCNEEDYLPLKYAKRPSRNLLNYQIVERLSVKRIASKA